MPHLSDPHPGDHDDTALGRATEEVELFFDYMPHHQQIALRALKRLAAGDPDGFQREMRRFDRHAQAGVIRICQKHKVREVA